MKKSNLKPILIGIFLLGLFIGLGVRIIYFLFRGVTFLLAVIIKYWFITIPAIIILIILIKKRKKSKKREKVDYKGETIEIKDYKIK